MRSKASRTLVFITSAFVVLIPIIVILSYMAFPIWAKRHQQRASNRNRYLLRKMIPTDIHLGPLAEPGVHYIYFVRKADGSREEVVLPPGDPRPVEGAILTALVH